MKEDTMKSEKGRMYKTVKLVINTIKVFPNRSLRRVASTKKNASPSIINETKFRPIFVQETPTKTTTIARNPDPVSPSFLLKPLQSFLLLGTHDIITPLNNDTYTCPNCHLTNSVHFVREKDANAVSKNVYICLSRGKSGCGWESNEKPEEEEVHKQIEAKIGFKPIRLA